MLPRVTRHLSAAPILALLLVAPAHAGVSITRTLRIDPDRLPAAGPIELPAGERISRVEGYSLECAEDGARAIAGVSVRVGYDGFERGRHLAWLELPDGCGLPPEHALHPVLLRVTLELEPSRTESVPRERVVPDWEAGPGAAPMPATESRIAHDPAGPSGAT